MEEMRSKTERTKEEIVDHCSELDYVCSRRLI